MLSVESESAVVSDALAGKKIVRAGLHGASAHIQYSVT